jgi:hypothetical protein
VHNQLAIANSASLHFSFANHSHFQSPKLEGPQTCQAQDVLVHRQNPVRGTWNKEQLIFPASLRLASWRRSERLDEDGEDLHRKSKPLDVAEIDLRWHTGMCGDPDVSMESRSEEKKNS